MLKIGKNGGPRILALYHIDITRVFQFTTSTSNASSSTFMVDYLVNSLGFSEKEAIVTSSKVCTPFQSTEKPDSVVNFLQNSGFNKTQIKMVVYSAPRIIFYNIEKTLKPKIDALKDLGLSGSEVAHIISYGPHSILCRSLNGHILPTLKVLKSVFGASEDNNLSLLSALKDSSWFLSPSVQKNLPSNVALLQNYGLSADTIKKLLIKRTRYFIQIPKQLQAVFITVEEKFGIPRDSPMFFRGVIALCSTREEYLESKFQIYRSFGWTESDILTLARRLPNALTISDSNITSTLTFFMKELGYQPAEIALRGAVMGMSLDKRVIPRSDVISVLKEMKLIEPTYKLHSCLFMNNSAFINKFVLPFKDKVPGLYDDYMRRVRSPLEVGK